MRRLSALLIALIIIGCAATQQVTETKPDNNSQYTWDGKYDPTMFFKWKMTDARQTESGHIMVRFENPNSDRKSTRLNSSHCSRSRMPSSA